MLDTIFGGTSSSRLFQEVRERRGLAYSVYSFTSAYQDAGQIGLYVGTRADNVAEALAVVGAELGRLREEPATPRGAARAKENLKGRVVLALESTGARMNRLGSEVLAGAPLLSLDETVERIDAVTLDDLVVAGRRAVGARSGCRPPASAPTRALRGGAGRGRARAGAERVSTIRVAVAGAAGRMGQTVCGAVEGADDMELVARADPALGASLAEALAERPDVLVDFTVPDDRVANAREAVAAGVHVVIGTTGFDPAELRRRGRGANVFIAPNFAIGAVLMMQFAAEAAQHMRKRRDHRAAPRPQARRAERHRRAHRRADARGRRSSASVPIHSVRLPGLVAHQEVILGDVGQTLTIRHDSIDRSRSCPACCWRSGASPRSPIADRRARAALVAEPRHRAICRCLARAML